LPLYEQLRTKYHDRDVEFFTLYVREPHPEERSFKQYSQHTSYDQRMAYAQELAAMKNLTHDVIVTEMDSDLHESMGRLPNMAYIVDKQGKVYYKATWTDVDRLDKALAELVTADDSSRPVEPSFNTRRVGIGI
jgi:hypothetical protein